MMVELVIFDMAGTTVHDGDAVNACLRMALTAAGVEVSRDTVNAVMGIAKPVAIRTLLRQQHPGVEIADVLVAQIHDDFLAQMLTFYRTDPTVREVEGAVATFHALRVAGVKVALDTGFSRPIADAILERLGWSADLLDATVTSDEVAQGRPYPDLVFRAMELTGVTDAKHVAKVGDTPSDLQEGAAAGCGWVIGVTEGSHTAVELARHPHTHLLPTVAEIPALLLPAT